MKPELKILCPDCKKPTKRQFISCGTTLVCYIPIFDEEGVNINPDKNKKIFIYKCLDCNKEYTFTLV